MITISQLAEILGVTDRTVYQWANNGEIPAYKVGNSWRFIEEEVAEWLKRKRNMPGGMPGQPFAKEEIVKWLKNRRKNSDAPDRPTDAPIDFVGSIARDIDELKTLEQQFETRLADWNDKKRDALALAKQDSLTDAEREALAGQIVDIKHAIAEIEQQLNTIRDEKDTLVLILAQRESKGDDDMGLNSEEDDNPGFWRPGEDDNYNVRVAKIANAIGRVMNAKGVSRTKCWLYTMLQDELSPRCEIVDIQKAGEILISRRICKPCRMDLPERFGLRLRLNPLNYKEV